MRVEDNKNTSFICFGGEDWWYKNRGHIDMQLMRRFARLGTTLYVNSIVMQKPNLKKQLVVVGASQKNLFGKPKVF